MDTSCDNFAENGFAIVRKVFPPEEVANLRELVYRQLDEDATAKRLCDEWDLEYVKIGRGDLLCKRHLWRVVFDKRILDIARRLLPPHPLVYFGDSVYQVGNGYPGFHRDNIDRDNLSGPDWQDSYPILRMAIYLQDHRHHSGGLKVKVGSHLREDGRPFIVDSEPGDVVVWNLRTLHSGHTVRLKLFPDFPWLRPTRHLRRLKLGGDVLPSWMIRPLERERAVMFMSFGVESPLLDRFVSEYLEKEEEPRKRMSLSRFGPEVWDEAEKLQVNIRRIVPEYGTPF
jgi:hypothetical protein